ncbi:MAG: hypothetical protein WBB42_15355 [Polyangiales bacterium]
MASSGLRDVGRVTDRVFLGVELSRHRGILICTALLVWLTAVPSLALAQTEGTSPDTSTKPSSLTYVEAQPDEDRRLQRKQRNVTIAGSILLGAGVAGGFLAAVAGNSGDDLSTGFVRGISVGVASLAIGVSGIALLARRRAVKKERQRLRAIVGPSFLGVRGSF